MNRKKLVPFMFRYFTVKKKKVNFNQPVSALPTV